MSGQDLESYWRGHVGAWKGSGMTLKAYSEAHGIGRWALGRWSRRFAAAEEVSAPSHRDSPGAVPMTASAPLVMEIVEDAPRRRTAKEQLVAETCEPGMSVSLVARRRGVDPSLLFRWRRQLLTPAEPPPLFAPVEMGGYHAGSPPRAVGPIRGRPDRIGWRTPVAGRAGRRCRGAAPGGERSGAAVMLSIPAGPCASIWRWSPATCAAASVGWRCWCSRPSPDAYAGNAARLVRQDGAVAGHCLGHGPLASAARCRSAGCWCAMARVGNHRRRF
jgi:Transposase and inactivated derivatives